MTSKKKLIVSLSSLCAVAIIAVLTVTLVLAFGAGSVKSTISVTYKADGAVKGTMNATYQLGSDSATAFHDEVTFTGSESGSALNKEVTPKVENIGLSRDKQFVIIKYSFTADTTTSATATGYTAVVKFDAAAAGVSNVKVEVSNDGSTYTEKTSALNSQLGSVDVTSSTAVDFYVKVSVVDTMQDASFKGDFTWTLTPKAA